MKQKAQPVVFVLTFLITRGITFSSLAFTGGSSPGPGATCPADPIPFGSISPDTVRNNNLLFLGLVIVTMLVYAVVVIFCVSIVCSVMRAELSQLASIPKDAFTCRVRMLAAALCLLAVIGLVCNYLNDNKDMYVFNRPCCPDQKEKTAKY